MIEQAYLPTADEVERARATVEQLEADGAGTLGSGEFVDAAMLGAARQIARARRALRHRSRAVDVPAAGAASGEGRPALTAGLGGGR